MAHNGELIDEFFNPDIEDIYKHFIHYFDDPLMIKLKNVNKHSMYICKVFAMLGIEFRYIIAFVTENNKDIGSQEKLSELRWVSLQTRTLKEDHDIKVHSYIPKRTAFFESKIRQTKKAEEYTEYNSNLPLKIILLNNKKGYSENGTLMSALETYNTVINIV